VIGNKQLNLRRWQLPGDIILWYGIEEICKNMGFQVQCLLKMEQMSFYGSICHAHETVAACFNKRLLQNCHSNFTIQGNQ